MDRSVEFAFVLLLSLNGKVIEVYINELLFAKHAVNRKIFARFAHWTCNLDCQWKLGIKDVVKMVSIF
jgi:hypothetical protein